MKIRVGLSTTNSIWSNIIRRFIGAKVSHSYIKVFDKFLQTSLVIHADHPGVIIEHSDTFDLTNVIIEEYEINDARLRIGLKKNLHHLKKKYDWGDLLNWALVLKFKRWFKRKVKNPLEDPKKLICVDLVVKILNDSGITSLPYGNLHPEALREWLDQNYIKYGWKKYSTEELGGILIMNDGCPYESICCNEPRPIRSIKDNNLRCKSCGKKCHCPEVVNSEYNPVDEIIIRNKL